MKSKSPFKKYNEERVSPFHRYRVALEYVPATKDCIKAYNLLRERGLVHCTENVPRAQNIFLEVVCSPDIIGRIFQTLYDEFHCWISIKEI